MVLNTKQNIIIRVAILFILFSRQGVAQNEKIDSLLQVIKVHKEDTNKVNALNELCFEYASSQPDKGIEYEEQGLALAVKIKFMPGKAESLNNLGLAFWKQGNYKKALEYHHQSLNLKDSLHDK